MNQLSTVQIEGQEAEPVKWELKTLKPVHKQICALLAQGYKNVEVAGFTGVTKEYITMLLRQPIIKEEIQRIADIAGVRLEAMFEKSVDVISEAMQNGNHTEKLKAARLHGELTKRIGKPDPNNNLTPDSIGHLEKLAERLIALQTGVRQGRTFNESGQEISDAELVQPSRSEGTQSAQSYGDG